LDPVNARWRQNWGRSKEVEVGDIVQLPAWLGTAVLGAVIAALSYVAKLIIEWIIGIRARARARRARLVELYSLLRAGTAAMRAQSEIRGRLYALVQKNHPRLAPDLVSEDMKTVINDEELDEKRKLQEQLIGGADPNLAASKLGYERVFTEAHPMMLPEEIELHTIIRAYTTNVFRPMNEAVFKWLQNDDYFKARRAGTGQERNMTCQLAKLEAHLWLWLAKYPVWIPDSPEHALVYLADEAKHGVGFPTGIDEEIRRYLGIREECEDQNASNEVRGLRKLLARIRSRLYVAYKALSRMP
jgi:hypothetical protein